MKHFAWVGGYTGENNAGVNLFEVDGDSGELRFVRSFPDTPGHTYLCKNKAGNILYATAEDPELPRGKNGALAAYEIKGGKLEKLCSKNLGYMTAPCHVSLSSDERTLAWAEYSYANFGVVALEGQGHFGGSSASSKNEGCGPNKPRQDKAHAHFAHITPDGKFLQVVDLGLDLVKAFDISTPNNTLAEASKSATIKTAPGLGPRHMVFHPNGKFAFLVYELGNAVSAFRYENGTFHLLQTLTTLPATFKDFSKAAAIRISPDGSRLLVSNRGCDSIAVFSVDADTGSLQLLAINPLTGAYPRDFNFVPGGKFVIAGHKMSNEIATYFCDRSTGVMKPTGFRLPVFRPTCIIF